jgi:hypothetical protein
MPQNSAPATVLDVSDPLRDQASAENTSYDSEARTRQKKYSGRTLAVKQLTQAPRPILRVMEAMEQ